MEFLHVGGDNTKAVDYLRINWFYRPKEISRKAQDTRLVFATMHSDTCPLSSLRGKCQIKHRSEIPDLAEYKRSPDCFWFEKLYDRYIQKIYEVIPTSQIVNVPEHVKRVLDERWKFILAESGRAKELTSAAKVCKRCSGYCARYVDRKTCKESGSELQFSLFFFWGLLFFLGCCSVWAGRGNDGGARTVREPVGLMKR